jgi:hypothetical protein
MKGGRGSGASLNIDAGDAALTRLVEASEKRGEMMSQFNTGILKVKQEKEKRLANEARIQAWLEQHKLAVSMTTSPHMLVVERGLKMLEELDARRPEGV